MRGRSQRADPTVRRLLALALVLVVGIAAAASAGQGAGVSARQASPSLLVQGAVGVSARQASPSLLVQGAVGVSARLASPSRPRQRISLNSGWTFRYAGDDGETDWADVNLPHTWNAEDAFDKTPGYRRGLGIYRRELDLPASPAGATDMPGATRYFLYFEGANQVAEVYVNGEFAGSHVGGYTAFAFDITDLLWQRDMNEIEVLVDNSHNADVPPLEADFTLYGGLYRDVWLVTTAGVHLDVLDYGGPGVYVSTPVVTETSARVEARTRIVNDTESIQDVFLALSVVDESGATISTDTVQTRISPAMTETVEQVFELEGINLWTPETPTLYDLHATVIVDERAVDDHSVSFGIRSVLVTTDGFLLNGLPYRLIGTNRHQDYPGIGNALPDERHRSDMLSIKETGFNFVRLAHYPQDPSVLATTDESGLAVWEEIPVVNTITLSPRFGENAERMLIEMIRQHGNHPSIFIWGLMNEALLRVPDPEPAGYRDSVRSLAERLQRVVRREDPHRPTALAVSFHEVYDGSGVSAVSDILGMNLYFGWYYEKFEDFGVFLDSLHAARPERALFVSEYGAGSDERVHTSHPRAFDFSAEHAIAYHRSYLPQILDRPYLAGSAVWNHFDFGSAARQDTRNAINQKGIYNFDRTPKDQARYYRAMLGQSPYLAVERDFAHRFGWEVGERRQALSVFTNADSVSISGSSDQLTSATNNGVATFEVTLQPGEQRYRATGWWSGSSGMSDEVAIRYAEASDCATACGYAVNLGGHYSFEDAAGTIYMPDVASIDSTVGPTYAPADSIWTARRIHHRITGTDDDPRYQAFLETGAPAQIKLPVFEAGEYELTLGFMDPDFDVAGRRVFSITVDGAGGDAAPNQPVDVQPSQELDIASEVGRWAAVERTFAVTVSPGQKTILIDLTPTIGRPVICSIRLRRR